MSNFKKWFKERKWYTKILIVLLFPLIGIIIVYLYINKKRIKEKVIYDKNEFVRIERDEDKTQKLPETPDLDETLDQMGEHMNE